MQNDLFFPARERLKVAPANQSSKMQDGWGAFAGRFEQAIHFARRVGMLLGRGMAEDGGPPGGSSPGGYPSQRVRGPNVRWAKVVVTVGMERLLIRNLLW